MSNSPRPADGGGDWIDAREVAVLIGATRATVYGLAKDGRIRSMTFASPGKRHPRYRFRREWVAEFIEKHTNEPRN